MEYLSHSSAETEALGRQLAARLQPGMVVAFRGGLGMGKTAFTRGLARGLGYTGHVTSPTFTIVNEYEGPVPLFHFDMYRLADADALFDIIGYILIQQIINNFVQTGSVLIQHAEAENGICNVLNADIAQI